DRAAAPHGRRPRAAPRDHRGPPRSAHAAPQVRLLPRQVPLPGGRRPVRPRRRRRVHRWALPGPRGRGAAVPRAVPAAVHPRPQRPAPRLPPRPPDAAGRGDGRAGRAVGEGPHPRAHAGRGPRVRAGARRAHLVRAVVGRRRLREHLRRRGRRLEDQGAALPAVLARRLREGLGAHRADEPPDPHEDLPRGPDRARRAAARLRVLPEHRRPAVPLPAPRDVAAVGVSYRRIATEEAFAPPELLQLYRGLLRDGEGDKGFQSLWGFYLGSAAERPRAVVRKLADLGAERIADMDAAGIDHQVLALTAPGTNVLDPATARSVAALANDVAAQA